MNAAIQELTPSFVIEEYEKHKAAARSRMAMATSNWPTALAHDCEAYAVYNRTVAPEKRRKVGADLAMIFSEGNDQARMVKRDLIDAGFEVSGEEEQMAWPKYEISGRRDLLLWKPGMREKVRVEVKSTSPWTFEKINAPRDLWESSNEWLVKWARQIALYMILQSVEKYWLLMKNKQNGQIKIVEFLLDNRVYEAAEAMIKKAEKTNELVRIGQAPSADMKLSDADVCSECPFFDTCLPDLVFGPGAAVLTEEQAAELSIALDKRASLEAAYKEYKSIDDEVKGSIKALALGGINKVVAGDWIAQVKEVPRKAYSVPAMVTKNISFVKASEKK